MIPQEAYWRSLGERAATEAKQAYDDAIKLARNLGLDYAPASALAEMPLSDLFSRIEMLLTEGRLENPLIRKAVLGGVPKPKIMLSDLYARYEQTQHARYEQTQRTALVQMSPDQQRKWKAAKKRAVEILIEQSGNKALQDSREDALAFADWWEDRVIKDGINIGP